MRKQRFGRIINIASSSFKEPINNLILSNTFRTGVLGLSKTLATELAPYNILINTIGPGRISTERVEKLDLEIRKKKVASTSMRLGKNSLNQSHWADMEHPMNWQGSLFS